MQNSIDEGLKALTLETVGDGGLEEQFQERLQQAREILADFRRLECTADRKQKVVISCEIEIERDVDTGTYQTDCRAVLKKRPAPLKIRRAAHLRDDGFRVKPEIQETLFDDEHTRPN